MHGYGETDLFQVGLVALALALGAVLLAKAPPERILKCHVEASFWHLNFRKLLPQGLPLGRKGWQGLAYKGFLLVKFKIGRVARSKDRLQRLNLDVSKGKM